MGEPWERHYEQKVMSAEDAVRAFAPSGSKVFIGGLDVARHTLEALLQRVLAGEVEGIELHGNMTNSDLGLDRLAVPEGRFRYRSFFNGANERTGMRAGSATYVPLHLSNTERYLASVRPDVAIVPMTPPDEHGRCNIGPLGFTPAGLRHARAIVAQINPCLPAVNGTAHDYHVSQLAAVVEHAEPLAPVAPAACAPEELKIAEHIVDRVRDGACIQLGIGGLANAVGQGLRSKRHLGVHSEMFPDVMAELQREGVIDNSRKTHLPGVSVAGFAVGTPQLHAFIERNPAVLFTPYERVNDFDMIRANDDMVSVNSAIAVDLTGQVCAESFGSRQYSGTGGQVDYVRGAAASKGGMSFVALTSRARTSAGPASKIVPTLAPGSVVTTLRTDVHLVCTEYGCVDLRFCDIPTRAKRLISIAHPDVRDELAREARALGLLY